MTDGLLLLHAWPLDARMWEPQLRALPPDLTVVAPSHPGFGATPSAGPVMTMDSAARNALAALDAAGIDRAVVCGLSVGGYVTFELWRRARERFLGMVLANTRALADTPDGVAGRLDLAARLRAEGNVLVQEPPKLLAPDAPADLVERVRALISDQPAESIAAASVGMAERPDSTPDLASIDVPTLVITSTQDQLIPAAVSAEMASRIPDARLETLEGAGHLTNLEAPEAFNRLLLEHLVICGVSGA
ncbi:MAG TPA: alpha/beta fold hydrolase [Actinomycetota bacterium]|nr:alpha/beta fold hydrolase [Actinomycetota bacterium]